MASVFRGLFGAVDDDDVNGAFGCFEFEAELFLEGGEDRWSGRVPRRVSGPFDAEIVVAGEGGVIDDGAAGLCAQVFGESCHGGFRG